MLRCLNKKIVIAGLILLSFPVFAQNFQNPFQSIAGSGHFRYLGNVGLGISHSNFYQVNISNYMNDQVFLANGYPAVIRGRIRYTSNVINVPDSLLTIMENRLVTERVAAGDLYEFVFPFEKGQFSRGYLLVILYAQETWDIFDCAQAFFIAAE